MLTGAGKYEKKSTQEFSPWLLKRFGWEWMQQDFHTLKRKMLACRLCNDLPLGPNPIFQLDERAKILIVGQAPGRITHLKNRPFDDPSGDRLRDWLGIDKSAFYEDPQIGIFPMGLCFPGTGSSGDKPPPDICATTWRKNTMDALKRVELTLVLGAYAIAWHLPHLKGKTVTDAVKLSWQGQDRLFVLPHPSPRNNRWLKQNPWFETDVIPTIRQSMRRILSKTKE
ncbi:MULTISPECIES: uracil-DNA glycosylase family protein [Pacificibacter]|uniref:uracil-DNA glycosylase family protein n=1 Tax=Pacificibacter TaxID=1042323 RepID=UPI0020913504|nr:MULTISPECIES: uracil-DNA glycosylase family protein [Pacificibacter]MDO6614781.1 uracil-DNA glycosylase family protein [Pacificibacter sp. 1_MG-2023]